MKDIGILTFHKSNNYGSVLQAYALQQAIEDIGYSAEIIDYEPHNYDYLYALFRRIRTVDDVRYNIGNLQYFRVIRRLQKEFSLFRVNFMKLTRESYKYGMNLEKINNQFENLVCGSDQIWNPKSKDSDDNYFFPFQHKAKKISYAVSLNDGSLQEKKNAEKYKIYLLDFDAISVREKDAQIELEKFLNKKVHVCLDPTLLHFSKKYDQICSEKFISEHYIFFYSIGYSYAAVEAVEKLIERTGLKAYVLYTGRGVKRVLRKYKNIKLVEKNVSPCDFLSLIKYADYVVTDSFHGTAFSIIYHKKFFSIGKTDENNRIVRDSRVCNILEQLQLEERFISAKESETIDLATEIDYTEVDRKRRGLREDSIQYLISALE